MQKRKTTLTWLLLLSPFTLPAIAAGNDSLQWKSLHATEISIEFTEADRPLIQLIRSHTVRSKQGIEEFFDGPFPGPVRIRVFPDRASLTEFWRIAWQAPDFQPQCWMVASGTGSMLTLLSPRVWTSEACEHDSHDSVAAFQLIMHELVHVFQGQHNPHPELDGLDDIAWFVEGVATYASGQLARSHAGRVSEALKSGKLPNTLNDVWTGPYRYGLSASLVRYIDITYGRRKITAMLEGTSEQQLLAMLGTSESELLSRWETFLRAEATENAR
jgi:hypothetical protein